MANITRIYRFPGHIGEVGLVSMCMHMARSKDGEKQRYAEAAEKRIEEAGTRIEVLKRTLSEPGTLIEELEKQLKQSGEDVKIDASAEKYGEGESSIIFDGIRAGESDTVWFVSHDDNNNFVCGTDSPCFNGNSIDINKTITFIPGSLDVERSLFQTTTVDDMVIITISLKDSNDNDVRENGDVDIKFTDSQDFFMP